MKKRYAFLIIFVLTGLVMGWTNPSEAVHKAAVTQSIQEAVQEEQSRLQQEGNLPPLLAHVDESMLLLMIEPLVKQAVLREDYIVFSMTRVQLGKEDHRVGIGLFGKVFIAPQLKQSLKENIQQYLQ